MEEELKFRQASKQKLWDKSLLDRVKLHIRTIINPGKHFGGIL
jgi:hypothetical protein